MKISFNSYS